MSEWIKCSDRLPEESGIYPACSTHPKRDYVEDWLDAFYYFNAEAKAGESKWQHSSGFYDNAITHWIPLPEPPTE